MGDKYSRYGRYGSNTAGTPQHFYPKDWGDSKRFVGSALKEYVFRDPKTGQAIHIHAQNEESAKAQADAHGWIQYRKRKSGSKSKKK